MLTAAEWTELFDIVNWITQYRSNRGQHTLRDLSLTQSLLDFTIRQCCGEEWDLEWDGTSGHIAEIDMYLYLPDKVLEYSMLRYGISWNRGGPTQEIIKKLGRLRHHLEQGYDNFWLRPNPPLCSNHPWGYCPPLITNAEGWRIEGCYRFCPCPEHKYDCNKGRHVDRRDGTSFIELQGACPAWYDLYQHQLARPTRYDPDRPSWVG